MKSLCSEAAVGALSFLHIATRFARLSPACPTLPFPGPTAHHWGHPQSPCFSAFLRMFLFFLDKMHPPLSLHPAISVLSSWSCSIVNTPYTGLCLLWLLLHKYWDGTLRAVGQDILVSVLFPGRPRIFICLSPKSLIHRTFSCQAVQPA